MDLLRTSCSVILLAAFGGMAFAQGMTIATSPVSSSFYGDKVTIAANFATGSTPCGGLSVKFYEYFAPYPTTAQRKRSILRSPPSRTPVRRCW
jgi:hypothetical protein